MVEQLIQISLAVHTKLRDRIMGTKLKFTETQSEVYTTEPERTPAYTHCNILNQLASVIIDTGSGISIMSFAFLNHLGWKINQSTKHTIIVADGSKAMA